jgi:Holliday junction resolvase RusA-like endonuclease
MSYKFDVDIPRFPTKKNSLVICLNKTTGRRFLKPSSEADAVLKLIAWAAKSAIPRVLVGDLRVSIGVYGRLRDLDNVCGSVFDALELSGRIKNDRQICELSAKRLTHDPRKTGCTVSIEEIPVAHES